MIPDKINICGIPFDVEQRDDLNLYSTSSEVIHGNIEHASRITGINRNCISRACSGEFLTAGKMKWRYAV